MLSSAITKEYLQLFPPVASAFCAVYPSGSSLFRSVQRPKQETHLYLAVEDVSAFHRQNFKKNPRHYPLVCRFTKSTGLLDLLTA